MLCYAHLIRSDINWLIQDYDKHILNVHISVQIRRKRSMPWKYGIFAMKKAQSCALHYPKFHCNKFSANVLKVIHYHCVHY